jgi:hypothetical protein
MTDTLHFALAALAEALHATDDDVKLLASGEVDIHMPYGLVTAAVMGSSDRVALRAFLMPNEDDFPVPEEVQFWICDQVEHRLVERDRFLTTTSDEPATGSFSFPRLRAEFALSDLDDLLKPWHLPLALEHAATSWRQRDRIDLTVFNMTHIDVPDSATNGPPQNAWILVADAGTTLTETELATHRRQFDKGFLTCDWTGPKHADLGDLALLYWLAPEKSVRYVARIGTLPEWTDQVDVNAAGEVRTQQWWVYLTPPIEIEPIPFKDLQDAHDGQLILKGRSGKYLPPDAVRSLTFKAKKAHEQAEVDSVTQVPTGLAALPNKDAIDFAVWRQIAAGALRLEADVSDYIVEPLLRWSQAEDELLTRTRDGWYREFKTRSGYVDFVLRMTHAFEFVPIEVKLGMHRPTSGDWMDSPDFRQLRRYMDDLNAPGVLIDARSILLVMPGATSPYKELVRTEVTESELMHALRYHPIGKTH